MIEQTLVLLKPDAVQRSLVGEIISRFEQCGLKIVAMKMQHAKEELTAKHYAADENWMISVGEKTVKSYAARGVQLPRTALEHGRLVRNQLMDFLAQSPIIALVLEGHNAVSHVRRLVGPTSPENAAPGTIRGDYSIDTYQLADNSERALQNLIHASESVSEAKREISVWFTQEELFQWTNIHEAVIYRGLKNAQGK